MNLKPSDEQRMLAETVTRYLAQSYPFEVRLAQAPDGFDRTVWRDFAELGLLGLALPERFGGFGGGMQDAAIVTEAMGGALCVQPFIESAVVAGELLARCDGGATTELVAASIAGEALVVLVEGDRSDVTAVHTNGEVRLSGSARLATWAPVASDLLVPVKLDGDIAIVLIGADSRGLDSRAYRLIDGRPAADLTFDCRLKAEAVLLTGAAAREALETARDHGTAAVCAHAVGLLRRMIADTRTYLLDREQFGSPLAGFQALQHRYVDMFMEAEQADAAALLAALACDEAGPDRARAVSAAKIVIDRALRFVSQNAVQLHGAMGMTEELAVGHFFRRAAAIELEFGQRNDHVRRYADALTAASAA